MLNIFGPSNQNPDRVKPKRSKLSQAGRSKAETRPGETFKDRLILEREKVSQGRIFEMVSELDRLGERLKDFPSVEDFGLYRNLVQKIISSVLPQAFEVEKHISRPTVRNPRAKEFHLVKEIDAELTSLMALVQSKQKNNLKIAAGIVKIKGMIVDCLR